MTVPIFYVAFYSADAPLTGFCVRSRLSSMFPLLDGGRTANLKFEQTGIKFATPTVNKINAFGEEDDVAGRMLMIERLGGVLKYNDVADKVFRSNLSMIDLHFPPHVGRNAAHHASGRHHQSERADGGDEASQSVED